MIKNSKKALIFIVLMAATFFFGNKKADARWLSNEELHSWSRATIEELNKEFADTGFSKKFEQYVRQISGDENFRLNKPKIWQKVLLHMRSIDPDENTINYALMYDEYYRKVDHLNKRKLRDIDKVKKGKESADDKDKKINKIERLIEASKRSALLKFIKDRNAFFQNLFNKAKLKKLFETAIGDMVHKILINNLKGGIQSQSQPLPAIVIECTVDESVACRMPLLTLNDKLSLLSSSSTTQAFLAASNTPAS